MNAASSIAAPILWNRLGSSQQVSNSAYGPNLSFYSGGSGVDVVGNPAFVPGVFGNALTIGPGSYSIFQREHTVVWSNLNQFLNPARGTIEVWYKQMEDPVGQSHGVYRIFDGSYGLGSGLSFTSEMIPDTRLYFGLTFGGSATTVEADISAFNGTWIHLAGVWDRDGIGESPDKLRLYVNGAIAAASTEAGWGDVVGQRADIGGGNDANIGNKFALDNLKVFDDALTDFSNRFDEAAGIPQPPAQPILWNRLGSSDEVLHSAYGPNLDFYSGGSWPEVVGNPAFVPGMFGDALTIGAGSYGTFQREHTVVWNNLNEYLDPARGTIEVWYKQVEDPVGNSHGVYRIFDGSYGLGSGLSFTSETIPKTRLYFGLTFGGSATTLEANISAFNGTWIHLAGVWDRAGIGGSTDTLRLYVNGSVAAATTVAGWGNAVGQQADIGGGNDANIADKFALDNLKVFGTALTDFSNRFNEAAGIPVPPVLQISLASSNYVRLSWPTQASGYFLQASSALTPGQFTTISALPVTEGAYQVLVLPMTNSQRLFRLAQ